MENIQWLDGKDAKGKFVLEIEYANRSKGYLKNESEHRINEYYKMLQDCPEVAQLTIYNPNESIVVRMVCFEGVFKKTA